MPTDEISIRIHEKLRSLSHTSNRNCIFKVYDHLRSHNQLAYRPRVISIGPYHHGNCDLEKMEMYKLRYLQELLDREEKNVDTYISALRSLESDARKCYAEEIHLTENDFVEMMCLDGCFVIEFLRKHHKNLTASRYDSIFQKGWLVNSIYRDLLLFENQIPFFILNELFEMTKIPSEDDIIQLGLGLCYLMNGFRPTKDFATQISACEVKHLLDLVYKGWCSSFDITNRSYISLEYIKSATELRKSGVKIRSARQYESWLHITFKDGIIEIPTLTVNDFTESLLRNIIAYEQHESNLNNRSYVTDYVKFLDLLIDSPTDVERLRRHGVIVNLLGDWLGDDKVISDTFNKILRDITVDVDDWMFSYGKVFEEVNKYSSSHWNRWKARCVIWVDQLVKKYFSSPWSFISFLAAVVLLILAVVQTIFSILAVSKGK